MVKKNELPSPWRLSAQIFPPCASTICRAMQKKNENIELMICLEMMGYGSKKHKQDFPIYEMKDKYPSGGDYLGVFSLPSSR